MFTERDHHQSWVAGAVIACGWLFCGVAVLGVFFYLVYGPDALVGVYR
jgi:hypothetical protein